MKRFLRRHECTTYASNQFVTDSLHLSKGPPGVCRLVKEPSQGLGRGGGYHSLVVVRVVFLSVFNPSVKYIPFP